MDVYQDLGPLKGMLRMRVDFIRFRKEAKHQLSYYFLKTAMPLAESIYIDRDTHDFDGIEDYIQTRVDDWLDRLGDENRPGVIYLFGFVVSSPKDTVDMDGLRKRYREVVHTLVRRFYSNYIVSHYATGTGLQWNINYDESEERIEDTIRFVVEGEDLGWMLSKPNWVDAVYAGLRQGWTEKDILRVLGSREKPEESS